MKLDTKCPVCNLLDEDDGHHFLKCKLAKHVWRALTFQTAWARLSELANARDVLDQMLKEKEDNRLLFIIML
jgi:hypothetical protein